MVDSVEQTDWSKGANNRVDPRRIQGGFYRDSINLVPNEDGTLSLRPGFEQVVSANTGVRGAVSLRNDILLADGADLVLYHASTNQSEVARSIVDSGQLVGTEMDGELFFCTANECLRYDGQEVRPWGTTDVFTQPAITGGGTGKHGVLVAVTVENEFGEEGGTGEARYVPVEGDHTALTVAEPAGLPAGSKMRVYASSVDGTELFFRREGAGVIDLRSADSAPLTTQFFHAPSPGHLMGSFRGMVLIAQGNFVVFTSPMRPHLHRPMRDFLAYGERVKIIAPVEDGVFIVADRTYFISGLGTDDVQQALVSEVDAVEGSMVRLPDRSVVWMTEYGHVRANSGGQLEFLSRDAYSPRKAPAGGSGYFESNGQQSVVTSTKSPSAPSSLAASDFYDAEIIYP